MEITRIAWNCSIHGHPQTVREKHALETSCVHPTYIRMACHGLIKTFKNSNIH